MANQHTAGPTPEELEAIRALHAAGHGRNEIARLINRSPRFVSIQSAKLNLSYDRTATEAATRARNADLAEKRSILADALADDALRLSAQLWEPATIHSFGGKDHTYNSADVDEPPPADKRALMAAATAAAAQSARLVPPVEDTGLASARSMLGMLAAGLAEAAKEAEPYADGEEAEGESP